MMLLDETVKGGHQLSKLLSKYSFRQISHLFRLQLALNNRLKHQPAGYAEDI